ncbi:MAG: acylphosphatase [Spirochaetes bacterium]|nr:acylphosphatase [Spirochaetota bacterium]
MKKAVRYIVKGRVQGVGFRFFARNLANRIGIYGYAKNCYDGSVEVYAIGTEAQLLNMKKEISTGPSLSRVDNVIEEDAVVDDSYKSFGIKF